MELFELDWNQRQRRRNNEGSCKYAAKMALNTVNGNSAKLRVERHATKDILEILRGMLPPCSELQDENLKMLVLSAEFCLKHS